MTADEQGCGCVTSPPESTKSSEYLARAGGELGKVEVAGMIGE